MNRDTEIESITDVIDGITTLYSKIQKKTRESDGNVALHNNIIAYLRELNVTLLTKDEENRNLKKLQSKQEEKITTLTEEKIKLQQKRPPVLKERHQIG